MTPRLIKWARKRAKFQVSELAGKSGLENLREWESGKISPTSGQMHKFAEAVHVPEVYLYLPEPPDESLRRLNLQDFRTVDSKAVGDPSANMLATIYDCRLRQSWYQDYARSEEIDPVGFIGSARSSRNNHKEIAKAMEKLLNFGLGAQEKFRTVQDALRAFRDAARNAGVLVMKSKNARNSYRRKLDVKEFRGFALSDPYAPLVFVNEADSGSAQMFTLAHELAHLWLGVSGVSSVDSASINFSNYSGKEAWCNRVAAEFLVPMERLEGIDDSCNDLQARVEERAISLKVSKHVILRRLLDHRRIDEKTYKKHTRISSQATVQVKKNTGFASVPKRIISNVGRNFAVPLVVSTLEGMTLYLEAFNLLGTKNPDTFRKIGQELKVI